MTQDASMEEYKIGGTQFRFSATKIGNLGATEYTLFGLAADKSGSVYSFAQEIESCVKSVIESCQRSPRADNLMARLVTFDQTVHEVHGFKPLADCHLGNYAGCIQPGGGTALYDASVSLVESVASYGKSLLAQDYGVNGIVCVVTDGYDEHSTLGVGAVREALANAMKGEAIESLVSILIGVNVTQPAMAAKLKAFHADAGFSQYVQTSDASPKTLAKLAGFISKSVSSQSQSLGTKAASQPISVTF